MSLLRVFASFGMSENSFLTAVITRREFCESVYLLWRSIPTDRTIYARRSRIWIRVSGSLIAVLMSLSTSFIFERSAVILPSLSPETDIFTPWMRVSISFNPFAILSALSCSCFKFAKAVLSSLIFAAISGRSAKSDQIATESCKASSVRLSSLWSSIVKERTSSPSELRKESEVVLSGYSFFMWRFAFLTMLINSLHFAFLWLSGQLFNVS